MNFASSLVKKYIKFETSSFDAIEFNKQPLLEVSIKLPFKYSSNSIIFCVLIHPGAIALTLI